MAIGLPSYKKQEVFNLFGRLCQLVGAIAVCVYYGRILNRAMRNDIYGDARWIYATTVGAISGLSALTYLIWGFLTEFRAIALLFAWDVIIVIMWTIVSGIFGYMYLGENPEMDQGIQDMKTAAWFDLANLLLWMISASYFGWAIFGASRKPSKKDSKEKVKTDVEGGGGDAPAK